MISVVYNDKEGCAGKSGTYVELYFWRMLVSAELFNCRSELRLLAYLIVFVFYDYRNYNVGHRSLLAFELGIECVHVFFFSFLA